MDCIRKDYESNAYDALSYTWGSTDKPHDMHIGNYALPIGTNLRAALLKLRHTNSVRIIWVDAICINQDDVNERNHQVHIMKRIFSRAASVIVWLGPESPSYREAMELIIDCNRPINSKALLSHKEDSLIGLSNIFRRRWWKRIWIVQEAVAANELVIFCGRYKIPWHFVSHVCNEIREKEFSSNKKSQLLRSSGYRNFTALNDFRKDRGRMSLTKYLQCTKDYKATDARDKLYALIGVASDISPEDIVPDYTKPTRTVFLDLVRFLVVQRGSLDIISSGRLLRPASTTPSGTQLEAEGIFPSWFPDWRVSQELRPLNSEGRDGASYRAGGDTPAVVRMDAFPLVLEAEGIIVDKVDFFGGAIRAPAQNSLPTLQRWQYIAGQHLVSESNFGAVTPLDFWTTIVAGKNYKGSLDSGSNKDSASFAQEAGFLSGGKGSQEVWMADYFADAVTRAAMGRRFFITAKKRMGLGVPEIQPNDRVVVLKGCSVPLIMRAVGDHMVIVGESYVSGIMNGEVIEGLTAASKQVLRAARPTEGPWVAQQGSSPIACCHELDSSTGRNQQRRGPEGPDPKVHRKVNQFINQSDLVCRPFSLIACPVKYNAIRLATAFHVSNKRTISALTHRAQGLPTRASSFTLSHRMMQASSRQADKTASSLPVIGPPPSQDGNTEAQHILGSLRPWARPSPAVLSSRRSSSL
ncbi:hypothetical protein J7T55_007367 [Diaporthe amygdali]|uniref:uncharacterized protein n=1 Tax=Phomopsis amygdali TaxID=1214568 RepID=UPI0022FE1107|nr:uncharacterized protein J7T55_007367 [Diaporthe amygdali]KAJ0116387.1 hypothetical protein J7T55_007367 [Diaporthe amygdali]